VAAHGETLFRDARGFAFRAIEYVCVGCNLMMQYVLKTRKVNHGKTEEDSSGRYSNGFL